MSATTARAIAPDEPPRAQVTPIDEPTSLRVLEWSVFALAVGVLTFNVARSDIDSAALLPDVLAWVPVIVLADLMPVTLWNSVQLTMSLPILLSASLLFPPYVAGLLALVATTDVREFRRQISLSRALFNRSNVALSVVMASWLFHALGGDVRRWPTVVGFTLAALLVDTLINNGLTIVGFHLLSRVHLRRLLAHVYGENRAFTFVVGYICFGLLAVLLATVYVAAGNWGLVVFAVPAFLARQMFVHGRELIRADREIHDKSRLLEVVSSRIADERREERLNVAAGLHDDVLPPLYKVHLMGQVLRQDLAAGRLLALEDDLPDLLAATETANDGIRALIQELRETSLGPRGLDGTLALLAHQLERESRIRIDLDVDELRESPIVQLLTYQVAREALQNAVKHSRASKVVVQVRDDGTYVRLVVRDDGVGFDPDLVDGTRHFGLQLMRERIELIGGDITITSEMGKGSIVAARFPREFEGQQ